jgi:hypothetical protein
MMETQQKSVGRWIIISTALAVCLFVGAGCSSSQAAKPTTPPANPAERGISQNLPSTTQMISGTTTVSDQAPPRLGKTTKSPPCPKLDSLLNQVVASSDPLKMAASLNLRLREGKVQVLLVLASADPSFLEEFEVEPGSQAGQEIQAFVPLDRLCEIANLEQVLAIRIPAQGILP